MLSLLVSAMLLATASAAASEPDGALFGNRPAIVSTGVVWRAGLLQSQWTTDGAQDWKTPLPVGTPERTPGAVMADISATADTFSTAGYLNPWTGRTTRFSQPNNMFGYSGQMRLDQRQPTSFAASFSTLPRIAVDGTPVLEESWVATLPPKSGDWHDIDIRLFNSGSTAGPGVMGWNREHGLGWTTNRVPLTSAAYGANGWNWFTLEGSDDEPMSLFRCRTDESFLSIDDVSPDTDGFAITVAANGGADATVTAFFGASAGAADGESGWTGATDAILVPAGESATISVPWADPSAEPWFVLRATGARAGAFEQWTIPLLASARPTVRISVQDVAFTGATASVTVPFLGMGAASGGFRVELSANSEFVGPTFSFAGGEIADGGTFRMPVSGLSTGTVYYARAIVSNDLGTTSSSDTISFATEEPGPPEGRAWVAARGFTTLSAVAKATSFGFGSDGATMRLEASESPDFRTSVLSSPPADAVLGEPRSLSVSGLANGTDYHLRVLFENEWGVVDRVDLGLASTRAVPFASSGMGHAFSPDGATLDVSFDVTEVFDGATCVATLFYGGVESGSRPFDSPGTLAWEGLPGSATAVEATVVVSAVANGTTTEGVWTETIEPGTTVRFVSSVRDHASAASALRLGPGDRARLPEIHGPAGTGYEVLNPRFASLDGTVLTALEPGVCGIRCIDADSNTNTLALLVLPEPIADGAVYILRDDETSGSFDWERPETWERLGSVENDSWPHEPDDIAILPFFRPSADYGYVRLSSDVSLGGLYVGNHADATYTIHLWAQSGSSPTLAFRRTDGGEALFRNCPNTAENRIFDSDLRDVRLEILSDTTIDGGWSGLSNDRNRGLRRLFVYGSKAPVVVPEGVTLTIRGMDGKSHIPILDASIIFPTLEGGGTIWNRSAGSIRFSGSSPNFTGVLRDSGHIEGGNHPRREGPTVLRAELPVATAETVGWVPADSGFPRDTTAGMGAVITGWGHPFGESWYGLTNWFAGSGLRMHGGTWFANGRGMPQPENGIDADRKFGRILDVGPGLSLLVKELGKSVNWIEFETFGQTDRGTLLVNDPVVSSSASGGDSTNSVTILRGWRAHAAGGTDEGGMPVPCHSIVPWIAVSSSLTSISSGVFSFAGFDEEDHLVRPAMESVAPADATTGANVYANWRDLVLSSDKTVNSLVLRNTSLDPTDAMKTFGKGRTLTVSSGGLFLCGSTVRGVSVGIPGDSRNGSLVLGGPDHPAYVWACGGSRDKPHQIWTETKAPCGFVSSFTGCLLLGGDQTGIAGEIAVNAGTLVLGSSDGECVLATNVPVRVFANATLVLTRAETLAGNEIRFDGAAGAFGRVEIPAGLLAQCRGVRVRDYPESPEWTGLPDGLYAGDASVAVRLGCAFVPDLLSGGGVLRVGDGPVPTGTWTTPVSVPYAWLDEFPAELAQCGGDYETFGNAPAANGANAVWQCYVAGLDPTSATNRFLADIVFDGNGDPIVGWSPDLGAAREYEVEGKASLSDDWGPTNASSRFFRVKVSLPE